MTKEEKAKLQAIRTLRRMLKTFRGDARALQMAEPDLKYLRLLEAELIRLQPEETILQIKSKADILDRKIQSLVG
jgi:hypothetical protein